MLGKIIGALGQVAEAGGTIVGIRSGTEEPDFTVERKIGNVEIRRYGPRIAAETAIAADEEAAKQRFEKSVNELREGAYRFSSRARSEGGIVVEGERCAPIEIDALTPSRSTSIDLGRDVRVFPPTATASRIVHHTLYAWSHHHHRFHSSTARRTCVSRPYSAVIWSAAA